MRIGIFFLAYISYVLLGESPGEARVVTRNHGFPVKNVQDGAATMQEKSAPQIESPVDRREGIESHSSSSQNSDPKIKKGHMVQTHTRNADPLKPNSVKKSIPNKNLKGKTNTRLETMTSSKSNSSDSMRMKNKDREHINQGYGMKRNIGGNGRTQKESVRNGKTPGGGMPAIKKDIRSASDRNGDLVDADRQKVDGKEPYTGSGVPGHSRKIHRKDFEKHQETKPKTLKIDRSVGGRVDVSIKDVHTSLDFEEGKLTLDGGGNIFVQPSSGNGRLVSKNGSRMDIVESKTTPRPSMDGIYLLESENRSAAGGKRPKVQSITNKKDGGDGQKSSINGKKNAGTVSVKKGSQPQIGKNKAKSSRTVEPSTAGVKAVGDRKLATGTAGRRNTSNKTGNPRKFTGLNAREGKSAQPSFDPELGALGQSKKIHRGGSENHEQTELKALKIDRSVGGKADVYIKDVNTSLDFKEGELILDGKGEILMHQSSGNGRVVSENGSDSDGAVDGNWEPRTIAELPDSKTTGFINKQRHTFEEEDSTLNFLEPTSPVEKEGQAEEPGIDIVESNTTTRRNMDMMYSSGPENGSDARRTIQNVRSITSKNAGRDGENTSIYDEKNAEKVSMETKTQPQVRENRKKSPEKLESSTVGANTEGERKSATVTAETRNTDIKTGNLRNFNDLNARDGESALPSFDPELSDPKQSIKIHRGGSETHEQTKLKALKIDRSVGGKADVTINDVHTSLDFKEGEIILDDKGNILMHRSSGDGEVFSENGSKSYGVDYEQLEPGTIERSPGSETASNHVQTGPSPQVKENRNRSPGTEEKVVVSTGENGHEKGESNSVSDGERNEMEEVEGMGNEAVHVIHRSDGHSEILVRKRIIEDSSAPFDVGKYDTLTIDRDFSGGMKPGTYLLNRAENENKGNSKSSTVPRIFEPLLLITFMLLW